MASFDENKNSHRKIIMTHTQTTCPNCITLHTGIKGARPANVGALASVFKKSAAELKLKQKLLKCKHTIQKRYSSEDMKYHDTGNGWTLATASAWKNSVNAMIGGVEYMQNQINKI